MLKLQRGINKEEVDSKVQVDSTSLCGCVCCVFGAFKRYDVVSEVQIEIKGYVTTRWRSMTDFITGSLVCLNLVDSRECHQMILPWLNMEVYTAFRML